MYKCFICKNYHTIFNDETCNSILNIMINNYKNLNINQFDNNINNYNKVYNKKKTKNICNKCGKSMSNSLNLQNHILKNICNKQPKEFKCNICNKIFLEKRNLDYHIQNNVCNKKKYEIKSNINTQNIQNINNQTINNINNNTQNVQNNLVITVGNTDDLKKVVELIPFRNCRYQITPEKYLEYANNPEQAIKKFIKDEHFNLDKPERMNVHNSNSRSNRVQIFDKDEDNVCRWMTKDKTTINELLYDRGVNHLYVAKNILEANGIILDPRKERMLQDKIKEYETDDKIKKEYIGMISDLTYDYRDQVDNYKKIFNLQLIDKK